MKAKSYHVANPQPRPVAPPPLPRVVRVTSPKKVSVWWWVGGIALGLGLMGRAIQRIEENHKPPKIEYYRVTIEQKNEKSYEQQQEEAIKAIAAQENAESDAEELAAMRASENGGKNRDGMIHVRGYTRRDGTYVPPHNRRK